MTDLKQEELKSQDQLKVERYAAISVKLGQPADDVVSAAKDIIANADGPMTTHDLVHAICTANPDLFGKLNGDMLNRELELADEATSMNDVDGRIHYMSIAAVIAPDDLGGSQAQKLG